MQIWINTIINYCPYANFQVKWMACTNKGFMVHISNLADVQEKVQVSDQSITFCWLYYPNILVMISALYQGDVTSTRSARRFDRRERCSMERCISRTTGQLIGTCVCVCNGGVFFYRQILNRVQLQSVDMVHIQLHACTLDVFKFLFQREWIKYNHALT